MTVAEARARAGQRSEQESLIRSQILSGIRHWESYKTRVDSLTRLVLGDWDVFDGEGSMLKADHECQKKLFEPKGLRYGYLQHSYDEGVTNYLQFQFWSIVASIAYRLPEIGFEGLKPEEAAINAEYLKSIFRPEGKVYTADTAMTYALAQRVIGGLGWVAVLFRDGAPYLKKLDVCSEVVWDPKATHPEEAQWAAQCVSAPLSEWVELFDGLPGAKNHFDDLLINVHKDFAKALDQEVQMVEYWSLTGQHAWFRADKLDSEDSFLLLEDSPWFILTSEGKQAFLPLIPHRHLQVPRAGAPHSLVEAMTPYQRSIRNFELTLNTQIEDGQAFWDVVDGSYDEKELDKIGRQGAKVIRKGNTPPAVQVKGAEVSGSLLEAMEMMKTGLVTAGGGNPYAGGQQAKVRFSREVEALQANAGLMEAAVAEGYAKHWGDVAYYTLALGKAYDVRPMELTLDDVTLQFGPEDPVGQFLRLTPDVVIGADSSRWKDPAAEVNKHWNMVQMALQMGQLAPKSALLFYKKLLQAAGERDVAAHLATDAPMQVDPAAMAEASLQ